MAIEQFGTGEPQPGPCGRSRHGIRGLAFALNRRQARLAAAVPVSGLAWGVLFVLFGVVAPATLAPALLVACGIALTVMDVAGRTALQRAVHDEVLARVFGILESLMTVRLAVGSILLPLAVGVFGIPAAAAAFAAVIPLVVVLASPGLRAIDRRANVPVRALAVTPVAAVRRPRAADARVARPLGRRQSVPPATVVISRR